MDSQFPRVYLGGLIYWVGKGFFLPWVMGLNGVWGITSKFGSFRSG